MATLKDIALAEYESRHVAWQNRGREMLRPIFTDKAGKLQLDPLTKAKVAEENQAEGLLILTADDGSNLSFAVYPDDPDRGVWTVTSDDGGQTWTRRRQVSSLEDLGEAIAKGEA